MRLNCLAHAHVQCLCACVKESARRAFVFACAWYVCIDSLVRTEALSGACVCACACACLSCVESLARTQTTDGRQTDTPHCGQQYPRISVVISSTRLLDYRAIVVNSGPARPARL